MTIAEAFRVFGEALDVEFAGEQSVAEVLSTIAVKFGGTRQQSIADAANEIAKVADHITAIGDATLVTKSITDNGTYNATSDEADGYSTVTVEVPAPALTGFDDVHTAETTVVIGYQNTTPTHIEAVTSDTMPDDFVDLGVVYFESM